MKQNLKKIIINSIIVFIICFVSLFVLTLTIEFSSGAIFFSIFWSRKQMIIAIPILAILEKTRIKNTWKIILTLIIILIISIIYMISNFTVTF